MYYMKSQCGTQVGLMTALAIFTIISGLVTVQTMWVYAQTNLYQVLNQTGNQTGNQTLSSAIPGQ
ncbi:hypothetical protein BH18THE1_BH18THE1_15380 [soil metagenome]